MTRALPRTRPLTRPVTLTRLVHAVSMPLGVLGMVCAAHAQTALEAPSAATQRAAAPKGGFVFEERKPLPAAAQETLRQVNAIRAAGTTCGNQRYEPAPPLEWNEILERTALLHTRDMVARGNLSHTGSDGSEVGQRMSREGYGWSNAGENVAAGQPSTAAAIQGWLRSPGHCSNMMNKAYTDIGVTSVASGGTYSMYHTMVLGRSSGGTANRPGGAPGTLSLGAIDAQNRDAQSVLALINRLRQGGGTCGNKLMPAAPPLVWDERLVRAANWEALGAVQRRAADDETGDFRGRMVQAGFMPGSSHVLGGSGGLAPQGALQSWLANASNCESVMDAKLTHIGMAGVPSASGSPNDNSRWWWSLVLANRMFGDRLAAVGPVDRRRTDVAVLPEVVNHYRARGLTCKGEALPPVPPVATDARLDAVVLELATQGGDYGHMLRSRGVPWRGASHISGSTSYGPVVGVEDFVTGSYCKEFMSPTLTHVAGTIRRANGGTGAPNGWSILLVTLAP
jgi:uncharacterized protein YkwD